MATRMQQRRGTAAKWALDNITLADGELGIAKDTGVVKLGDGVTAWNDLDPIISPELVQQEITEALSENTTVVNTASQAAADRIVAEQLVKATGGSVITPSAVSVKGLVVKSHTGQTANLLELHNAAGDVLQYNGPGGGLHNTVVVRAGVDPQAGVLRAGSTGSTIPVLVVRGAPSQTANLAEFQKDTGDILAHISSGGSYRTSGGILAGGMTYIGGQLASLLPNPAEKGLVVRGAPSQTANLAEFQNETGSVLAAITSAGSLNIKNTFISGVSGRAQIVSSEPATAALKVQGAPSQTAFLAEFQNSSGTVLFAVDQRGHLTIPNAQTTTTSNGPAPKFITVGIPGFGDAKIPLHYI